MNKTVFGFQLAYFRRAANLTQEELALKAGCATSTISRIECGLEFPRLELFARLDSIFEQFGFTYEELPMNEIYDFHKAKDELLAAIHDGREEILERKLNRFEELMIKDNVEHQQYYALGYLICMRKRGMGIEEYIDRCIELFEKGRKIPKIEDLHMLHLTRIEHMIIFEYAKGHYELGELEFAEKLMSALMKYSLNRNTDYHIQRCKVISATFAKVLITKKDYCKAQKCINYLLGKIAEALDSRILYHGLQIQRELFNAANDEEGALVIDEFILASQKMVNYLHNYRKAG